MQGNGKLRLNIEKYQRRKGVNALSSLLTNKGVIL
jgi:hypothetical protein